MLTGTRISSDWIQRGVADRRRQAYSSRSASREAVKAVAESAMREIVGKSALQAS